MKRFILIINVLLWLSLSIQGQTDSFEEYSQKKEQEFKLGVQKQELAYKNAVELSEEEFANFVRKAEERWGEYTNSSIKEWVTYSGDADVMSITNFSDQGKHPGSIIVKALVDIPAGMLSNGDILLENEAALLRLAQQKIADQLAMVVQDRDPKSGQNTFAGQIKLDNDRKGEAVSEVVNQLPGYVEKNVRIVRKPRPKKSSGYQREYQIKLDLVPDHLQKRAKTYLSTVQRHASERKIPVSIVLAVIQTESYFNPHACSRPKKNQCLAYGLMQLVPKSGAREAYRYLYKKDRVVGGAYLFNPENNITLGVAYLGKMVNLDLARVDSLEKRTILAASSYNTGHGNTAKGMMKITSKASSYPKPTLNVIAREANQLNFEELLQRLKTYLPYKETRHYVEKIDKRISVFKSYDQ